MLVHLLFTKSSRLIHDMSSRPLACRTAPSHTLPHQEAEAGGEGQDTHHQQQQQHRSSKRQGDNSSKEEAGVLNRGEALQALHAHPSLMAMALHDPCQPRKDQQ